MFDPRKRLAHGCNPCCCFRRFVEHGAPDAGCVGGLSILLGGEAYVTFKPNLIDENGAIGDDSTKRFLQDFIDRFAHLVSRLAPAVQASAA